MRNRGAWRSHTPYVCVSIKKECPRVWMPRFRGASRSESLQFNVRQERLSCARCFDVNRSPVAAPTRRPGITRRPIVLPLIWFSTHSR